MIDLEDETIDAEVMDSLAVSMDNFRVSACHMEKHLYKHYKWKERRRKVRREEKDTSKHIARTGNICKYK